MLIDELKKAKLQAMKEHNEDAKTAISMVVSSYLNLSVDFKAKGKEVSDADVVSLIQKTIKSLEEEKQMYLDNSREETANQIAKQVEAIKVFLPKMMSEEEIKKVIEGLEDKSIKNVMSTFKKDYAGKVDMSLVSRIAKSYN